MKKIIYVAPHLSTGGLPQYLVKQIESIRNDYEIYVIEWSDITGNKLVIQRNRILYLLKSSHFYTLGEDKNQILDIIREIKPDIIHMEEIPEFFMDYDIAEKIYNTERDYFIVETSHDSSFDISKKQFFPDKFVFVSEWQSKQYDDLGIPKTVIYYPIEYKERPNREESLKNLGLNPNVKHVLHVGLFTPRKNQKEFFEYARKFPNVEFHCVGNQADNFKHYWGPLMKEKPNNVTWWNERDDIDNFYKSMDLFLFTSRGTANDKETMPLVIREALSWNMNILIYNLEVYLDYFDQFSNIQYLDFDSFENNIEKINKILEEKPIESKEVFIISTYPNTRSVIDTTRECIKSIQKTNREVILTSHIPIPKELAKLADYCVTDNNNILTKHTFYNNSWVKIKDYQINVNLKEEDNDIYHGPSCYTNYYNGAALAKTLGYNKLFFINFDYILKNDEYIKHISENLNKYEGYVGMNKALEGKQIITYFMAFKPEMFLKLPRITTSQEYENLRKEWCSESNGYENMLYHFFKNQNNLFKEEIEIFNQQIEKTLTHKNYSQVEYYTVLPYKNHPNKLVSYFQISNNEDTRVVKYYLYKNKELIEKKYYEITGKSFEFNIVEDYNKSDVFKIEWVVVDNNGKFLNKKTIIIDSEYREKQLNKNGLFTNLKDKKIRLVHLVTEPTINPKEIESTQNLTQFCQEKNIEYYPLTNQIYTDLPPEENCNRPEDISKEPGFYKLSPGNYGCFLAHKNGISLEDNGEFDLILIFEGDTIIDYDYDEFYEFLLDPLSKTEELNLDIVGFGNVSELLASYSDIKNGIYIDPKPFVPAQSYLIPNKSLEKVRNSFLTNKWDAFDLWLGNNKDIKLGISEKIYTKHLPGFSIVDQKHKDKTNDNPLIFKE